MNSRDNIAIGGRNMAEAFFYEKDAELIENLRQELKKERSARAIGEASGIKNQNTLNKLVELGITPEMAMSLTVIPLVEVAWADGEVDGKERKAILDGAEKCGISKGKLDYEMLNIWLDRKPPAALLKAWEHFINGLCEQLGAEEAGRLKEDVIKRARKIAETSGGFMGLTSKVSDLEKDMLAKLESCFG